jgi:hypothetical protein
MDDHKDETEMVADMDKIFSAAKRAAIDNNIGVRIVMSIEYLCGCILTRDTGTVVRDNKAH